MVILSKYLLRVFLCFSEPSIVSCRNTLWLDFTHSAKAGIRRFLAACRRWGVFVDRLNNLSILNVWTVPRRLSYKRGWTKVVHLDISGHEHDRLDNSHLFTLSLAHLRRKIYRGTRRRNGVLSCSHICGWNLRGTISQAILFKLFLIQFMDIFFNIDERNKWQIDRVFKYGI